MASSKEVEMHEHGLLDVDWRARARRLEDFVVDWVRSVCVEFDMRNDAEWQLDAGERLGVKVQRQPGVMVGSKQGL